MNGACGGIPLQFPRIWGDQPAVCFVAAIRPDIYSNLPIGTMSGKTVYVNVYIYILYVFKRASGEGLQGAHSKCHQLFTKLF